MIRSAPDDEPTADPSRSVVKEFLTLGTIAGLFVAGLIVWASAGRGPGPDRASPKAGRPTGVLALFVGDRTCRECHPGETASHSRSGHSRTLRPAAGTALAKQLDGLRVPDPEQPDVTWSYSLRDGQFRVERSGDDLAAARFVIDYAFGSGHHATTFFSLTDPDPRHMAGLEHRLTYYAATGGLGMTPGQRGDEAKFEDEVTPLGARLPASEVVHCFRCHTTMTSAADGRVLDPATMIPNVGCERCHGPGRAHVDAARRGRDDVPMPFGPERATADQQLRLCGQCHRYPVAGPAVADFEVPPADIRPDNPMIVRFQPVGLMQSACYTKGRGALSCTTCHNPHARVSKDRAGYEAICLSCHQAPPSKPACPVSPQSGCLGCHMPARESGVGIEFTDHWIRIRDGD